jgi:hypothetical protein
VLVSEQDAQVALDILSDEEGAACRASAEYLDSLTKVLLAQLMIESNETSATMKETWARAQPRFKEHLIKVGEMAKRDYQWRQRYAAADAKIRIFQTASANTRSRERI